MDFKRFIFVLNMKTYALVDYVLLLTIVAYDDNVPFTIDVYDKIIYRLYNIICYIVTIDNTKF